MKKNVFEIDKNKKSQKTAWINENIRRETRNIDIGIYDCPICGGEVLQYQYKCFQCQEYLDWQHKRVVGMKAPW